MCRGGRLVSGKCQLEVVDEEVAELAFLFIEGEALEREDHPDHVFSHPLGLLSLSSHPTVD